MRNATTTTDAERLTEIIFGWWSSRLSFAGCALGIFDALPGDGRAVASARVAEELALDAFRTYRLMRALASIGVLREEAERSFSIAPLGALLRSGTGSMRGILMHEVSPFSIATWAELEATVRDGDRNGVERAFGTDVWGHQEADLEFAAVFNGAMSSYSLTEAAVIVPRLERLLSPACTTLCDVGGGHGVLAAALLRLLPALRATVLELPAVAVEGAANPANGDVADRLRFIGGSALEALPAAGAYVFKHVFHDFDDADCLRMLRHAARAAKPGARAYVCEFVVPAEDEPHFAKLFDIHMLVMTRGRERTEDEYARLFAHAGWRFVECVRCDGFPISIVTAELPA